MIEQQFGEPIVGFRTLDLYLSAVLEFQLEKAVAPKPEWREVVAQMADKSCKSYRAMVKESPQFYELFTQVRFSCRRYCLLLFLVVFSLTYVAQISFLASIILT